MSLNGNFTRYVLDGTFIILIGLCGWIANKADAKVERHEARLQSVELVNMRVETKLNYLIKSFNELKDEIKTRRP